MALSYNYQTRKIYEETVTSEKKCICCICCILHLKIQKGTAWYEAPERILSVNVYVVDVAIIDIILLEIC